MAKTIMLQGTSSGAGKSTIMTGLCRIFHQDGYRVAPFKAQNLSHNAHRFADGRQMARSQAIGAYACGTEPEVDMNPLLLKPSDLRGSEVILQGRSIGYMRDYDYNALKTRIAQEVSAAHSRLSERFDIVVAEGAGSPVELNLKANDVVNMGFAKRANCPVLLVADINRGGVFASAYGTVMLLEPEERALLRGIIVNKFSGLREHFASGVAIMEEITGKPVLGVVPTAHLELEDEDNLTDGEMKTEASISKTLEDGLSYGEHMDKQFDLLADLLRENLDMKRIYEICGIG